MNAEREVPISRKGKQAMAMDGDDKYIESCLTKDGAEPSPAGTTDNVSDLTCSNRESEKKSMWKKSSKRSLYNTRLPFQRQITILL